MARTAQKPKQTQSELLAGMFTANLANAVDILTAQHDALGNLGTEDAAEARVRLAGAIEYINEAMTFITSACQGDD